jgi:predicted TIM-barrel enzyme
MNRRSLAEVLADIDVSKIAMTIDGSIAATDQKVADSLAELRELLQANNLVRAADPDGVQCHCGGGGGGQQQ